MAGEVHDVFLVPSQYERIQDAVTAVERPTTIVVSPGLYPENVVVRGKAYVVIQSAALSRRGVTVTGGGGAEAALAVEGSKVFLSGIQIRSHAQTRGIAAVDAVISLQDCTVIGNRIQHGNGAGMHCERSTVHIQKSTIAGNTIDAADREELVCGAGLYLEDCAVEIAGSNVQTNAAYSGGAARGGGLWWEGSRMRMWKSRVTDNSLHAPDCAGGGIAVNACPGRCDLGGSVISGNDATGGRGGGVFVERDATRVSLHRDTRVRQNWPDDVYIRR